MFWNCDAHEMARGNWSKSGSKVAPTFARFCDHARCPEIRPSSQVPAPSGQSIAPVLVSVPRRPTEAGKVPQFSRCYWCSSVSFPAGLLAGSHAHHTNTCTPIEHQLAEESRYAHSRYLQNRLSWFCHFFQASIIKLKRRKRERNGNADSENKRQRTKTEHGMHYGLPYTE